MERLLNRLRGTGNRIRKEAYVIGYVALNLLKMLVKPREATKFFAYIYQYGKKYPLEEIEIPELFPGINELPVSFYKTGSEYGNASYFELYLLSALVRYTKSQSIFEIGTFKGITTLHLAINSDQNARIFTLDLPPSLMPFTKFTFFDDNIKLEDKAQIGEKYRGTDVEHKITQLYGDSTAFDYSQFYGEIDFVFIDGSHQYEYVKSDSQNALELLKEHGVILWHDYQSEGVTRVVNELSVQKTIYSIRGTSLAIFIK
ncbi:class I SAM-dependent methyltransferase [Chloroflexota bacterium]